MELSIVIPIYNVEAYIGRCLDSVSKIFDLGLACEVIIVNDGTPDGSMAIVEDYAKKYPHIKIINQDNQGLGEARNVGLRHACGEYVYFWIVMILLKLRIWLLFSVVGTILFQMFL